MKYSIEIGERTGDMIGVIYHDNGDIAKISESAFKNRRSVINWIVINLRMLDPDGPVRATRKKVYNERVIERPGFWEVTTYNAKGEVVRSGQYRDIMQEGYLRGLVQDYFGFPLEAAEEIK